VICGVAAGMVCVKNGDNVGFAGQSVLVAGDGED
jgi:hypothetical protein